MACIAVNVLPNEPVWWPLKLAGATYSTLLVPGAVILRIIGWPRSFGSAVGASAAWSVAALSPGLALTFLLDQALVFAMLWLLLVIAAGLIIGRGKPVLIPNPSAATLLLIGSAILLSILVWLVNWPNIGDTPEHIARVRKITELDPLRRLEEVNLLPPSTGVHPVYAFPLWHAIAAIVTRISGIEEIVAFRYWASLLVPIAAAAVYGAGRSMFGSWKGGAGTWIAYLALFAFPFAGIGYYKVLSYPGFMSILVFWPVVLDRLFVYLDDGGREPLWTAAAASFVVTLIHPSYVPLMMMPLGAFLVTRWIIVRQTRDPRRIALALAVITIPFLAFVVWLYPIAAGARTPVPKGDLIATYSTLLDVDGNLLRIKPEVVTRGGAAYIAALLLVPVATLAIRTRAAAFIAGSSVVTILTLVIPWLFTPFSDLMSISQGRRLLFYIPWAFALVGGTLVLARFRYAAVAGGLAAGVVLQYLYPGDFGYTMSRPGPSWVPWVAVAGAVLVVAGGVTGKLRCAFHPRWAALAALIAFTLPVAVGGLSLMQTDREERYPLSDGVVAAVRRMVTRDDVVMAPLQAAYKLVSHAPVYVVAVSSGHGGDTLVNRHEERRQDVARFFGGNLSPIKANELISRYEVDWIVINKRRYPKAFFAELAPLYEDEKFALYRIDQEEE